MKETLVVNLFGGPGIGKSTVAAALFAMLKLNGVSCELVTEYAKDKVWEGSDDMLRDQIYVFAKQFHRVWALQGKVDVVVTDSPFLLSLYYGRDATSDAFKRTVVDEYDKMWNLDILLNRSVPYDPAGRQQTAKQAIEVDQFLGELLDRRMRGGKPHLRYDLDNQTAERLYWIVKCMREGK
jgi:hypothetical protein